MLLLTRTANDESRLDWRGADLNVVAWIEIERVQF
jgi:hypothetical protein